ncbi:MAG: type II toxin-antitoxin system VapC family toxin [Alphaproteobacteria bacterium]
MTLVVDASVACKWFIEEEGWHEAQQIVEVEETLVAPDLIVAEISNIFWRKVRLDQMLPSHATAGIDGLMITLTDIVPCAALVPRALEISLELDHPAYDCFYIALAERKDVKLVSADAKLQQLTSATAFERYVVGLSSIA